MSKMVASYYFYSLSNTPRSQFSTIHTREEKTILCPPRSERQCRSVLLPRLLF